MEDADLDGVGGERGERDEARGSESCPGGFERETAFHELETSGFLNGVSIGTAN
jgi:hypothetical protein